MIKNFDQNYFNLDPWPQRLNAYLQNATNPFVDANVEAIRRCLSDADTGLRMVVNIGAASLLSFLETKRYLNAYDAPIVGHDRRPAIVSDTRREVDALLDLNPPYGYYFGAIAAGGTGVRFYGEYCMVLREVPERTQIFDRNSYDLVRSPLRGVTNAPRQLRGTWEQRVAMLTLKILPELEHARTVVTLGTISDAILHDEEFAEVHRGSTFHPTDLEEVREPPEDETVALRIAQLYEEGVPPTAEELLWFARRRAVTQTLRANHIRSRVVVSSGRGNRWR